MIKGRRLIRKLWNCLMIHSSMGLFFKMFCSASTRRSTKPRESPGTTSTTQTMWAVTISSARSPLACSTCWMRRASKNVHRRFTPFQSRLTAESRNELCFNSVQAVYSFFTDFFPHLFLLIVVPLFPLTVPVLQLSPCHKWDIISQIQATAPGEQILCLHTSDGACLCHSTLCW